MESVETNKDHGIVMDWSIFQQRFSQTTGTLC